MTNNPHKDDEFFVNIGGSEQEGARPIYIFLHLLRDKNFNLALVPRIYGMMMDLDLISDPSILLVVVTLDQEKKRVTVIHHPEQKPIHFTREEIYRLFHQSLSLERKVPEMLVVGFHRFYFYTKFSKTPLDKGIRIPFGEGLEEIGQILYRHAF